MHAFHTAELVRLRSAFGHLWGERQTFPVSSARLVPAYEAVIGLRSGEVIGFQATSGHWVGRRAADFDVGSPGELEPSRRQIAGAPDHGWLMLELDADYFLTCKPAAQHAFLQMLRQHVWSEREIIVNVVCAGSDTGPREVQGLVERLQCFGMEIAVEESCLRRGLFSLTTLLDATIVCLDSSILSRGGVAAVEVLLRVVQDAGVQVVMTGVDDPVHYQWAHRLGVDGIQGRLCRPEGLHSQ
jgi:hypothetical protein